MIKLLKFKLTMVLILLTSLNACKTTEYLWINDLQSDEIVAFFVDKKGDRVVFIGEYDYMLSGKDHYHYSLKEPENKGNKYHPPKLLQMYEDTKDIATEYYLIMSRIGVKSKDVWGDSLEFEVELKDNISDEKKEYLKKEFDREYNEKLNSVSSVISANAWRPKYKPYPPFNKGLMTRYPSSKEKFTNFCKDKNYYKYMTSKPMPSNIESDKEDCAKIIPLKRPWQGKVTTFNSNTQIAYKTIATPFTLALDIASIPFAMIIMIFAGAGMSSR